MGDLVVVLLSWLLLKTLLSKGYGFLRVETVIERTFRVGCGRPGNARPKSCASKGKATRRGARSVGVIRFLLD